MMKRILWMSFFLLLQFNLWAQTGISFRDLTFKEAMKVAKVEKKLIFLDCYTSWCGPCKMLAKKIFPDPTVGEFFNEKFVSLQMDMEKAEGPELGKKYKVGAYPTLLFIDEKGELKHSVCGYMSAEALLQQAQVALKGEKTLEAMTARYDAGEREDDFVEEYLELLFNASQEKKQEEVASEYIGKMDAAHFHSRKTWDLLQKHLSDPLSPILKKAYRTRFRFGHLVGGDTINIYFDYTQRRAVNAFVWRNPKQSSFNQKRYDDLLQFLRSSEQSTTPQNIATLYVVKQVEEGNLRGMIDEMKQALHYGIFYDGDAKLRFFQNFMRHVQNTEQKALALEMDAMIHQTIEESVVDYYQTELTKLRIQLLNSIGETEKAAELEQTLPKRRG